MDLKTLLGRFYLNPAKFRRTSRSQKDADAATICRGLGRGINLGNALEGPAEGEWGVTLREEFFPLIKDAGFSCIRVPIRWSAHAAAKAPYRVEPAFFERVDWVIAQAKAQGLWVVLDLQHYDELFENPAEHEERFLGIWRQIARRYRHEPPSILFELLNEPHGKIDAAKWNGLLERALGVIRPTNPSRLVVVGAANWSGVEELSQLVLPEDDRCLVASFHFYEPKAFTHQGAGWVAGSSSWMGTLWAGTEAQKREIEAAMDQACSWGKAHGRAVYLGEFGAYRKADLESRLRWTRQVARCAEARGMGWAYWEFCCGFGVYDAEAGKWREPLLNALIGETKA